MTFKFPEIENKGHRFCISKIALFFLLIIWIDYTVSLLLPCLVLTFLFDSSGVFRNQSNYKDGTLTKIVNGFAKKIILDVGLGYDCASR